MTAKAHGHAEEHSPSDGADAFGGAEILQAQIAQIRAAQANCVQLAQLEAKRQMAIRALQAEADAAQADFVAAMKSSDHEVVAKAVRRMSRAETALVNLGYTIN
jgi:hypothetical protein